MSQQAPGVDPQHQQPDPERPASLWPYSGLGRSFTGHRKVRLGDVDRSGRLRLDALTRYTQDVSDDDTTDAGLAPEPGWVVRSTVVDEVIPAALGETLTFLTFCSGLGRRWAERRLTIGGELGARYEVATLWVCIDHQSGRPHHLTEQFLDLYGKAADDRTISAKLTNPKLADRDHDRLVVQAWQLRAADYDVYDHVNNAAYWAVVEQLADPDLRAPRRITMEYGQGVGPGASVDIACETDGHGCHLWWLPSSDGSQPAGPALATASIGPLPVELYKGS